MQEAYFKTGTSGTVAFIWNSDGRIDFSALGREFKLDPSTIKLNGVVLPKEGLISSYKWEQIQDYFKKKEKSVGTEDDPVILTGEAGVPAVSTGGLISKAAWLQQRLPPLHFGNDPPRFALRWNEYINPVSVATWDLHPGVQEYLTAAYSEIYYHMPIAIEGTVNTCELVNEANGRILYFQLLSIVGRVIVGSPFRAIAGSTSRTTPSRYRGGLSAMANGAGNSGAGGSGAALVSSMLDHPAIRADIVLQLGGRNIVIVEIKSACFFRSGGRPTDTDIVDLEQAYRLRHEDVVSLNEYPVRAQVVDQLFTYMHDLKVSYGIISSVDVSYFVWSRSDGLHISQGVAWEDPEFVKRLSYFLNKAAKDTTEYAGRKGPPPPPPKEGTSDEIENKEEGGDEEHPESNKLNKSKNPSPTRDTVKTRSMKKVAKEMPRECLHLEEMPVESLHLESHPFATGWSGNIVRGTYEGVAIAVKLAVVGTFRAQVLVQEASAYLKLRNCWGKYVPALISYGTTALGYAVYVATELIVGSELRMRVLTPQVVRASFEALQAIHGLGVLHGDIRRQNIMVPCSGQGVRFIDFGFSRAIATEEDRCKELHELQAVIDWLGPLTRASPPRASPPRAPLRGPRPSPPKDSTSDESENKEEGGDEDYAKSNKSKNPSTTRNMVTTRNMQRKMTRQRKTT